MEKSGDVTAGKVNAKTQKVDSRRVRLSCEMPRLQPVFTKAL